jgi:hypothetical protein
MPNGYDTAERGRVAPHRQDSLQHTSEATSRVTASPVHVFISYARDDCGVAHALYEELIEVNPARVNCFLDTKKIESGRDFEDDLISASDQADWLICIYTGEQSEYCGYEIGVFKKTRSILSATKDDRLVCLHDVDNLPGVFRNHQNHVIRFPQKTGPSVVFDEDAFYLNSPIAAFFKNFYKYKGLYVPGDPDEAQRQIGKLIRQSKRITEAFKAGRVDKVLADTPTQLLMEVRIHNNSGDALSTVPNEAEITGTFQSLGLFGLMPHMVNRQLPVATWGRLKQVLTPPGSPIPIWVENLEQDMVNAANGLALIGREMSFNRNQKIWRPILYKHVLYEGGGHKFEILFVETLPRQFLGAKSTSALLAAIIMASRFRFAYFEESDVTNASVTAELGYKTAETKCRQLVYDLERLEYEAMEFGLDAQSFIVAFGEEKKALAESFIETWEDAKEKFLSVVRPFGGPIPECGRDAVKQAIDEFLKTVESENRRFLLTAIDLYRAEIQRVLRPPKTDADAKPRSLKTQGSLAAAISP